MKTGGPSNSETRHPTSLARMSSGMSDRNARRLMLAAGPVAIAFQTSFWSPMFRRPDRLSPLGVETPGTQGIL